MATTVPSPFASAATSAPATPSPLDDPELIQLATEYRKLRPTPGHFGGGDWSDAVDQWQGRKHKLMLALAARLSEVNANRDQLVELLGAPDHVVTEDDDLWPLITSEAGESGNSDTYFVYEWRGSHDFLYFISHDGTVTGSGWWHAGE
jgi:hypothetical protein